MKKTALLTALALLVLLAACAGKTSYHKTPMPDPKTFKAHFGDMDANGDDLVNWDEFKAFFPMPKPRFSRPSTVTGTIRSITTSGMPSRKLMA